MEFSFYIDEIWFWPAIVTAYFFIGILVVRLMLFFIDEPMDEVTQVTFTIMWPMALFILLVFVLGKIILFFIHLGKKKGERSEHVDSRPRRQKT